MSNIYKINRIFYFPGRPGGGFMKKVEPLQDQELYMLRVIHQIINVQSFNTHSIRELTENFTWEKIGISINPSLALVNHSCDPNTIRCNLNKNTILVAGQHIKQGEEITDSYHVHFKNVVLSQRQYHTLKYYMFECECPACTQNWPLEDQIPDELPRIPNMETEAYFKKRTGDKKDIVKGIIDARRHVESLMAKQDHEATLLAYGPLCEQLEIHVRKPHIYYLQARSGIAHCLWNMFCRQKSKEDEFEDTDDVTGRDHAVKIYQSDFMEKSTEKKSLVMINGEMVWPVKNDPEKDAKDEEKRRILEATKQALMNTAANLGSVKADHLAMKDTIKSMKDIAWEHAHMGKVGDLNQIITDEEFAELVKQKEAENEMIKSELAKFEEEMKKVESEVKARREKEREELEKKRELEKKLREEEKEKAIAEKMKQYKEDEAKRKEERANRELQKKKRIEAEHKKKAERETKRLEEALKRRKEELKQEEDELEKLLAMVEAEDSINVDNGVDLNLEPLNNDAGNGQESAEKLSKEESTTKIKNDKNSKNHSVNTPKEENKVLTAKSNNSNESDKNSVWAAIRELKESALDLGGIEFTTSNEKEVETKEVVTEDAFDLFIKEIKAKAELAKKVAMAKPKEVINDNNSTTITDSKINESNKSENMVVNGTIEENNYMKSNTNGLAEHDKENKKPDETIENGKPAEPFDYVAWKKNMERFYKEENEAEMRAEAADQAYLMQLKQIINERIVKYIAESKVNDVNDGPLFKPKPKPKKVKSDKDEMTNLKHKEKERKRKKKEEKFKESEDKMKDVALKAAKIDKVVNYADQEIIRMRELISNLLQRSKLNDKEVEDLNLDEIVAQARIDTVDKASSNDQSKHWTEEDTNKWPNQNKKQDFTNALTVLRNSAISNIDAEKLKTSITAVKEAKPETKKTVESKDATKTIKEKEVLVNNNVSKPSIENGTTKHLPRTTESTPANVSTNSIEPKTNTQQSNIPKIIPKDKSAETNKSQIGIKSSNDTTKKIENNEIKNSTTYSKTQEKAVKQSTEMSSATKNGIQEDKKTTEPKVNAKVSAVTQEKKQEILPVIDIKDQAQSTPASKIAVLNKNSKANVNNSDKQKHEVKTPEKPKDNVITAESKNNNQTIAKKENTTIKVTQEVTGKKAEPELNGKANVSISDKQKPEVKQPEKPKIITAESKDNHQTIAKKENEIMKSKQEVIGKKAEPELNTNRNYEINKVATEKVVIAKPVKEKTIPKQEETTPIKENYSITKEPTQNIVIVKKFTQPPNKQTLLNNVEENTQNGKETKAALINKQDNTVNETKVKPKDEDKINNQPNGRPVTKIVFKEQKDDATNQKSTESSKLMAPQPESKIHLNQPNKDEILNHKPTENVEPKPEIKFDSKISKSEQTAIKEVKIEPKKTEHVNSKNNQSNGIKINGNETTKAIDTVKPVEIPKVENKVLTKPPQNGVTAAAMSPKVEKKINLPKVPVPSSPITKPKQPIPASPKVDRRITSPSPVRSQKVNNTSVEPQPQKVPDSPKAGGVFVVTPFTFAPPPQQQMRRPPPPNFKPPPPPSMKPPPPPPLF